MQIAHCVFEVPSPGGSGAPVRNHALNTALHHLGRVETHVVQSLLDPANPFPRRRSSHIVADLPEQAVQQIATRVAAQAPDLVVVEGILLADLARHLIADGHRVVIDAHNVESTLQRQIDIARRGLWARLTQQARWTRATNAERALYQAAAGVWACSAKDVQAIAALAPAAPPAQLVPNPVPPWCKSYQPGPDRAGIAALFVGHLGYRPNVRAVRRLAGGIINQLRAIDPDAVLTIAGRGPGRRLQNRLARAQVPLVADPVDLAPLYQAANMALIPLTEGGGTRIKVLEAMACRVPVIASETAVEGLGLHPGVHFLLARTDAEFATLAARLGRDAALRSALKDAASLFIQTHHGPDAITQAVRQAARALTKPDTDSELPDEPR